MAYKHKEFHKEENCLNCDYPLVGKYCANCGQKAYLHKDNFWHMAAHFAGDYFHYDNKFWTTIKALFTKPGLATLEFIKGKRAKFLNPIQLYFFVTTIFFLFFFSSSVEEKEKKHASKIPFAPTAKVDTAKLKNDIQIKDNELNLNLSAAEHTAGNLHEYDSLQNALPPAKRDGFINRYMNRRLYTLDEKYKDAGEINNFLFSKITHNFPKVFFFLLPFFALLLWLVFFKKKILYVDHIIFSLHLHSVLFTVLGICVLLARLINIPQVKLIIMLLFAVYMTYYLYRSLRVVYAQSGFRTFFKQTIIFTSYFVAFAIASVLLLLFAFLSL